jgi:hypothetical protein
VEYSQSVGKTPVIRKAQDYTVLGFSFIRALLLFKWTLIQHQSAIKPPYLYSMLDLKKGADVVRTNGRIAVHDHIIIGCKRNELVYRRWVFFNTDIASTRQTTSSKFFRSTNVDVNGGLHTHRLYPTQLAFSPFNTQNRPFTEPVFVCFISCCDLFSLKCLHIPTLEAVIIVFVFVLNADAEVVVGIIIETSYYGVEVIFVVKV